MVSATNPHGRYSLFSRPGAATFAPRPTPSTIGFSTFYSAVCVYINLNCLVSIEILNLTLSETNCLRADFKNARGMRVKFHGF